MEPLTQALQQDLSKLKISNEESLESDKENINLGVGQKISLQDSFKHFKKRRLEQAKKTKELKELKAVERQSPEYRKALRQKFIDQAKKYFGVPYAQRFFQPEEAHYHAPLFLDCCALIRQIVWDLREEFGFKLARWNQVR